MKKIFFLIFLFLLHAPPVLADDILVIQSLAIKPYNEAFAGCRSVCKTRMQRIISSDFSDSDLLAKVRKSSPDLILAIGQEALAKVRVIKDLPIVYLMVLNPQTLVRDSGHITGVSMNIAPDRQLSTLRQILPRARKIGVLFDPAKSGAYVAAANDAAESLDFRLLAKGVHSPREAVAAIDGMKDKIDALWLLPDTTVVNPATIDLLMLSAIESKIPVFTFSEKYVEKGALFSLEADPADIGRQAGEMANRIMSGKDVKGIEKEDARGSILTVNLIVAKKLGITINGYVIKQARVIK